MREIDFLPSWYPQIQRRCRQLILQAYLTIAVIALMLGFAMFKRHQLQIAQCVIKRCDAQLAQSHGQLERLNDKLKYQAELRLHQAVVARVGIGVDSTRLLKSLDDVMTPEMWLTNLSLETIEQPVVQTIGFAGDRKMKVTVDGIAPNDAQLATLLENLSKVKCFENVSISYFREAKGQSGQVFREFEFNFEINLNPTAEANP